MLANQKGGVGKTTTAVHLAHGLALGGQRTALFDLDPQGNATVALQGLTGGSTGPDALEALTPVADSLWILAATGIDRVLDRTATVDVTKLASLVDALRPHLDWLVVDCPPRMDTWGWAGLQVCDEVVVPVQAEFFAMHGLSQMLTSLDVAARQFPGRAQMRGVLATMVNMDEPISRDVLADLRNTLGSKVLESVILRDAQVVEAASHGTTVFEYSPWSTGACCYAELIEELQNG